MDSLIAWVLVALAGLGALAGVFVLTRRVASPFWRSLIRCLAAVWLLVPAPIGAVDGYYAPAFIVLVFEGLVRNDGNYQAAMLALFGGSLLVAAAFLVWMAVQSRRGPSDENV